MAKLRVQRNGDKKKKNLSKIETAFLLIAIFTILTSTYLFYHKGKGSGCKNSISKIIRKKPEYYNNSAIYLIYYLNMTCRPLVDYETIKMYPDLRIIFLFTPDHSDADIQNFKRVFNIDGLVDIGRMDDEWYSAYLKCNKNMWNVNLNFLIFVINGQIVNIKGF